MSCVAQKYVWLFKHCNIPDSDVFWGCGIDVGKSARFRPLLADNCP
jgi:hypothetical protein